MNHVAWEVESSTSKAAERCVEMKDVDFARTFLAEILLGRSSKRLDDIVKAFEKRRLEVQLCSGGDDWVGMRLNMLDRTC